MYNVSLTLSYLCWLYCIWSAYCYIFTMNLYIYKYMHVNNTGTLLYNKKWHVMTFYMYMCSYLVLHKIVHFNVCTLIYFKCTCKCMHSHQTQVHCSATQVHLHNACTGALVLIQMHCIQSTKIYLLKTSTMSCSVYLLSKWNDIFQLINELQGTVWSWISVSAYLYDISILHCVSKLFLILRFILFLL